MSVTSPDRESDNLHAALRVVATFGVISIHLQKIGLREDDQVNWFFGIFFYALARCSVPFFFIISGHFLLRKKEEIGTFLRKRAARIIPPLVAWVILYQVWNEIMRPTGRLFSISALAWNIASLNFSVHLWFLFSLLGAYLFVPILRELVYRPSLPHESINPPVNYFAALLFFTTGISTIAWSYTMAVTWRSPPVPAPFYDCVQYLGYMLIPFVRIPRIDRVPANRLMVVFVGLSLVSAIGIACLPSRVRPLLDNYSSWMVLAQAFLAYHGLLKLLPRYPRLLKLLSRPALTQACFGIYLVHCIFIDLLFQHAPKVPASAFLQIGLTLLVFLVSFLVIKGLSYIPTLRIFIGWPNSGLSSKAIAARAN